MESYDEEALRHIKSDVSTWFLMANIYPIVGITLSYVIFVTLVGPKMMRNRKPMNVSKSMMVYNTAHVVFSLWWLLKMTSNWKAVRYIAQSVLQPKVFILDEKIEKQIDELGYYYLMTKYVELLDTVFFILRRKWRQVTFLHVYHHSNMAIATWVYLKYIWGRHTAIICLVNSFVHAVMYSYYLLASLGPAVRPYLWWKKYITKLQLGQFIILLIYLLILIYNKCSVQQSFVYFSLLNTTSFLLLFINFYRKAYVAGKTDRTSGGGTPEDEMADDGEKGFVQPKTNGYMHNGIKHVPRLLVNDREVKNPVSITNGFTDLLKYSTNSNDQRASSHLKRS